MIRYCLLDDADRPHAAAIRVTAHLGWALDLWLCSEDIARWRAQGIVIDTIGAGTITDVQEGADGAGPVPGQAYSAPSSTSAAITSTAPQGESLG